MLTPTEELFRPDDTGKHTLYKRELSFGIVRIAAIAALYALDGLVFVFLTVRIIAVDDIVERFDNPTEIVRDDGFNGETLSRAIRDAARKRHFMSKQKPLNSYSKEKERIEREKSPSEKHKV